MKSNGKAKIAALAMAAALALGMCACSSGSGSGSESQAQDATTSGAQSDAQAQTTASSGDKASIEEALDLANMGAEWTYSEDADAWTLSVVTAVANPEIADEEGVSVCVPGAYVKGVDTDGDGEADATEGTATGTLVIDYDAQVTSTNGQVYTAATAPVIVNTGAAGYSEQQNQTASSTYASEGYINVACGNRGKQSTTTDSDGNTVYTGDAPSCLVDQKNAVRFVKYNILLGNLPGSVDYFVSTGGSGGGAHAAMLAATSDNPDFYDYEAAVGAVGVYAQDDGSYSTTVTIDGQEVELSDGMWGCMAYSAITSLAEADMAMAFEYDLDADYSFNTSFQQLLAGYLSTEYMDYINAKGLTVDESQVGFDLNSDGDLDDTVDLTIEYDEDAYSDTNGYGGTYLALYQAEFEQSLQDYLDRLDYAEDWTWFDADGNALSDEEVAAMTLADKQQAFIEGRYAKGSTGSSDGPGGGFPGGDQGGAPSGDGNGPGGTPPDGNGPGGDSDSSSGGPGGTPPSGAPGSSSDEGEDAGDVTADAASPMEESEGTMASQDEASADTAAADGEGASADEAAAVDESAAEGEAPSGEAPDGAPSDGDASGDSATEEVGTPDAGTTQAAGSGKDSANYASFADMLAAYQADIAEVEAGDAYGNNIVELYDPLNYIGADGTSNPTWTRVLMGASEGDMSMFSSLNLQIAWLAAGTDAQIEWQWDGGHVPSEILGDSLALYVDTMYGKYVDGAVDVSKAAAEAVTANGTAEEPTGTDLSSWVSYDSEDGVSFSLADAASYRTAGAAKATPGFDVIDYGQEDYVFGSSTADARHWDKWVLQALEEHADELESLFNAES